jgi:putative transposase
MRKSRFTDEQILGIVREVESGAPWAEVTRRHGISKETLRRWRSKYRGLELQEARRLKGLEDENRRLKKVVADQALEISLLKDVVGRKW